MKPPSNWLVLPLMLFLPLLAFAYWPTTLDENLPVSTDPNFQELHPMALPYPDGGTLVTLSKPEDTGNCYQIINRFGQLVFPEPQQLIVGPWHPETFPRTIADGSGGAFCVWYRTFNGPSPGFYAQRLDSLGNRLWGDQAVRITTTQPEPDFDISTDGSNGLLLAYIADSGLGDLAVFRLDGSGQLLWGPNGVVVCNNPNQQSEPQVTHDGAGGAYASWIDYRPPYSFPNGSVFMQRLLANGSPVWTANGIMIFPYTTWMNDLISDGQGGAILHCGAGGPNTAYRLAPAGNVLWTRRYVSWYPQAQIIPGETGFFYLGFIYGMGVYGQRMDMAGTCYWPTWGSGQPGAVMAMPPGPWNRDVLSPETYFFSSPYFYGLYSYYHGATFPMFLYANALNLSGHRIWGQTGVLVDTLNYDLPNWKNIIPEDEGGIVTSWYTMWAEDVWAKHINSDGSLGGPFPLNVTLTPHNPPIQIPPGGGSFSYELAIADTTPVGGLMDAWIDVILPTGDTLEILARQDLSIQTGDTLTRLNMQQFVPAGAPAGIYTYVLCAGNYPYLSPWGWDSFTFEKMAGGGRTPALRLGAEDSAWTLEGWEGSEVGAHELATSMMPVKLRLITAPNPFNHSTSISFTLPSPGLTELGIFDIQGRLVASLQSGRLSAGAHTISWSANQCSSGIYVVHLQTEGGETAQKILLLR